MTLPQQLSKIGKKAYVKLGDNLDWIVKYGYFGFMGGLFGGLFGLFRQDGMQRKIWHLADKLYEESADIWSERMPYTEAMEIATNTIDPFYNLYPLAGTVAGVIVVSIALKYGPKYGPELASRLIDTYHTWKEELGEQTIDI